MVIDSQDNDIGQYAVIRIQLNELNEKHSKRRDKSGNDLHHDGNEDAHKRTEDSVHLTQLRSWCRRFCKLGDELTVLSGQWMEVPGNGDTDEDRIHRRFVVTMSTIDEADRAIQVTSRQRLTTVQWQAHQQRYLPTMEPNKKRKLPTTKASSDVVVHTTRTSTTTTTTTTTTSDDSAKVRHGSTPKRQQATELANFLVDVVAKKITPRGNSGTNGVAKPTEQPLISKDTIDFLNQGSGVIDAAGGSGHVSMALGMAGVRSTVVDPREAVGKLPGRDRKVWKRAMKNKRSVLPTPIGNVDDPASLICRPVVQYDSLRAWFGARPDGTDTQFREQNDPVPVCDDKHDLLKSCQAIVALHPDEATEFVVDAAVKRRVPFAVVPCCVFGRLFPGRRMPQTGAPVATYDDFLTYLMNKDPAIQRSTLNFDGANQVLWANFVKR